MAKATDPLVINYFSTGLYTHRSALFSPYRTLGVNVVSYHDAAFDGQDMEIGSGLQWKRRPGFARFCSVAFGGSEFPLQFYSARQPDGTVIAFVDTNQHLSTFIPSALTPLLTKTTTSQGFIQQVGGMTYYANGSDLKKWNGSAVSGWGTAAPTALTLSGTVPGLTPSFWSPNRPMLTACFIVDYNGNIQVMGSGGGVTGAAEPVWNTTTASALFPTRGIITLDNSAVWHCIGSYQSAVWLPATAVVFVAGGIESSMLIDSNGNLQQCTISGTTGAAPPVWNAAIGGTTADNSATWTNRGPATLSVQSGYTYAYGFRTIYGHLSTLSPLLSIGAVMGPLSTPLTGLGTGDTQCNQVLTISNVSLVSNQVTILYSIIGPSNVVVGQNYTFAGLTSATFLNGQTVFITATTGSGFSATFVHANHASAPDTGTASFNGVEIYRTADGGGILYFDASLVNPGALASWNFTDTNPDASLITSLIGPLAHLNDPPPGTPGSLILPPGGTILAYWQGRIWMAVGNMLYFDAGPDCINGSPEESWPPANKFKYPGPITGLNPTSQGLLVWGADYLSMALGGPQTLSFFPYDLMQFFGVSSPNCITQDGDTISVLNTQGQCFTLDVSGKAETGNYIVNLLSGFAPQSSYITTHRAGTDAGLWLADGSTSAFRYSLNIGAWSTRAVPVGGIRALRSIETSVGVMTLCAGRTSGGGYILGRSLSTWQDDGQNYPNAFVTIGSIVLTPLGATLVPVEHIEGYFDAVGTSGPLLDGTTGQVITPTGGPTVPTISILPNEITASPGPGFLLLGQPKSLYTTAQVLPTASILSLRWDVDSMNVANLVSQWMHHLQIRISWPAENAPNAIKSIAVLFVKDK